MSNPNILLIHNMTSSYPPGIGVMMLLVFLSTKNLACPYRIPSLASYLVEFHQIFLWDKYSLQGDFMIYLNCLKLILSIIISSTYVGLLYFKGAFIFLIVIWAWAISRVRTSTRASDENGIFARAKVHNHSQILGQSSDVGPWSPVSEHSLFINWYKIVGREEIWGKKIRDPKN